MKPCWSWELGSGPTQTHLKILTQSQSSPPGWNDEVS